MNTVRKDEYTTLKVIIAILVIFAHGTRMYTRSGGIIEMPDNTLLHYITTFIYVFHMHLFLFISGAIYGRCISLGKYKNFKTFITGKAKRLLIPYVVFGIFYVTPVMLLLNLTDVGVTEYIFSGILCNTNSRHLWYLYALFIMLVGTRALKPLFDRFPYLIYLVLLVLSVAAMRYWLAPWMFGLPDLARYSCYFIFGIIFESKKDWWDKFLSRHWWISIASFLSIIGIIVFTAEEAFRVLAAYLGIIMCYTLVLRFKKYVTNWKLYPVILENSMGIYLFHPMLIYILFYFGQNANIHPYLFSILVFLISGICSYFMTVLIKRLKLGFILGE